MSRRSPLSPFVVVALGGTLVCFASDLALAKNLRTVTGKAQVLTLDTLKVGDKIVDLKWIRPLPDYRSRPYHHRDFKSIPKRFPHSDIRSVPIRATAINALRNLIGFKTVTCRVEVRKLLETFVTTREDYEGTCYLGDSTKGLDLNGWLVGQGWAETDRLGSVRPYVREERDARAKQLGAWSFMKKYRWCCADLSQEDYEHTADE